MDKRLSSIQRAIERIKAQLATLEDLRPGSLSEQYNVCGTPKCRCKKTPPKKHGPYYQLSYTRKGKSTTRFVTKPQLATVKRQLKNYARLRQLVDRWVDLSAELCELRMAQARDAAQDGRRTRRMGRRGAG